MRERMALAEPSPYATRRLVHSLEPWQVEGLAVLRERYSLSDDGLIRAGMTLVLAIVAAVPDAALKALIAESRRDCAAPDDGDA